MQFVARCRTWLARHPLIYWLAVAMAAGAAALGAWGYQQRLDEARRAWGHSVIVWVPSTDAAPGEPLAAEPAEWPAPLVPSDSLDGDPGDVVARQHIGAGEPITRHDVRPADDAAMVPPGWVAITVPSTPPAGVREGEAVRVFADGVALGDGTVIRVADDRVLVALPADAGGPASMAANDGRAVVALLGG
jgi:hypothetical protein